MTTHLTPQDAETSSAGGLSFSLKHTNVSQPSVIEHKASLQSITASEDYYSLESASNHSAEAVHDPRAGSTNTLNRYQTPPSRFQSRDHLPQQHHQNASQEEVRKTPMRGQGRRRQSAGESSRVNPIAGTALSGTAAAALTREGGIRRKPVPSTVMEGQEDWPKSEDDISPTRAQSSAAKDINREANAPTPGVDDTPYIRFALDQLTRDEEVRGSRRYPGPSDAPVGAYGYLAREAAPVQSNAERDTFQQPRPIAAREEDRRPQALPGAWPLEQQQEQRQRMFDEPPPRNPKRVVEPSPPFRQLQQQQSNPEPGVFLPVASEGTSQPPLRFLPGILRPLRLGLFLALLLAYLICLLFCAIWCIAHPGLWDYGTFGDGRYFIFQYLPTLLGMILLLWLIQIEVAVYRIAPFIAMSTPLGSVREAGAHLPLYPHGFLLPFAGHFRAKQPMIGSFMIVAWLQIWTIPLLGSSFNVYFFGAPNTGVWRWVATQGAMWAVIGLYILLFISLVLLAVYLARRTTGLKWDPRSLADIAVLLERSNALSESDAEGRFEDSIPQLGYWRTSNRANEVFHTYGIAEKEGRSYSVEDGRIREKSSPVVAPPVSRFSDHAETGSQRHSREKMLPRAGDDEESNGLLGRHNRALPWFLRPSVALLWPIIAIVLLLAFFIVSYIPQTRVSMGFNPDVPAPVNDNGFSGTNFLYSFIPSILAMLVFLFWLDIDFAYRRLEPYAQLSVQDGEGQVAERSLLLSYTAELPGMVTASALANGHWRIAALSFTTLLAAAIPVIAGGVFWAQFYVTKQTVQISAHMPAYYALSVFGALFALAFLLVFPSHAMRKARVPNKATSFADILQLFHQSRILDDVAFHSPATKTDLVTRLLSAPPGAQVSGQLPDAAASKVSLADSVRGFGRARQRALGGLGVMEVSRYAIGRYVGRDGREYDGIDRVRK